MSAVYDWAAAGDFEQARTPVADAVRRALVEVASGRLPSLRTLRRAVGVDSARALAIRDHLAHVLTAPGSGAPAEPTPGAEPADGTPDAPGGNPPPASTPEPDPACPRALDEFAGDLAEGRIPSQRQIRLRLHVGGPRAARVRAFLAEHAGRAA